MKRFILMVLTLTLASQLTYAQRSKLIPGSITKVSDGDTVNVRPNPADNKQEILKIRMIGIDTPEMHLPVAGGGVVGQGMWGEKARDQLIEFVEVGNSVVLESHGLDKYGRTLGRVFRRKSDVNLAMIKSGWALPYIICDGDSCNKNFFKNQKVESYLKACADARDEGLGVFDPRRPLKEYPFEFRARMQGKSPSKYVGDYSTKELYEPSEHRKVDICKSIFFITKEAAHRVGYQ